MKICPRCGFYNDDDRSGCASCGYDYSPHDGASTRRKFRISFSAPKFFLVLAILLTIAYVAKNALTPDVPIPTAADAAASVDPSIEAQDNSKMAYLMMCDFMRERVRTPGTTEFPAFGVDKAGAVKLSGSTYRVRGYVDFEGEGEIRVRRYFRGEIRQVSAGGWTLGNYEMGHRDEMARYFVD